MNRRHLRLYAPDDGAGSGSSTPGPAAPGQPSGAPAAPPPAGDDGKRITMSPDDLKDRLDKASRATLREMLRGFGFQDADMDDPDKLKGIVANLGDLVTYAREQKKAELTAAQQIEADLKTAQQQAEQERQKREQAEQERDALRAQLGLYVRRTQLLAAAADAAHPDDVYTWAQANQPDQLAAILKEDQPLFDDQGQLNAAALDPEAIKAIVETCKKDRREWWQGVRQRGAGIPSNAGAQPAGDVSKLDRQRELARSLVRKG